MTSGATERPQAAAPRDYQFPRFHRRTLSNGVQVVVAPVTKLPLISVNIVIDAGAAEEETGREGLATLTARLLLEGTAAIDGAMLTERLERAGASVDAHADWDVTTVSVTALAEHMSTALELVSQIVRAPAFPEREVQRLKDERLAELLQLRAEPRGLADESFMQALYAPDARYARNELGDEKSVSGLTRHDALAFHARYYTPRRTTLVFAGDITIERAAQLTTELFGDWSTTEQADSAASVDSAQRGKLVRIVAKGDAPQSEIRVGHVGLSRNTPGYFPATVMNAVLGGLFSSRINMNLREEHGYTYGASSLFDWRRDAGPFMIHTAVKSDVTAAAVQEILKEIERIRETEIEHDELTLATSYLDGVFPIRFETTAAIAGALTNLVAYELAEDYYDTYRQNVRAINTADVLRAAREYLRPEDMRIVIVGDPSTIGETVEGATGITPEIVHADESRGVA
jgi:predicted Zn-dependent peptidase